jgi:hypothetical protein
MISKNAVALPNIVADLRLLALLTRPLSLLVMYSMLLHASAALHSVAMRLRFVMYMRQDEHSNCMYKSCNISSLMQRDSIRASSHQHHAVSQTQAASQGDRDTVHLFLVAAAPVAPAAPFAAASRLLRRHSLPFQLLSPHCLLLQPLLAAGQVARQQLGPGHRCCPRAP